jgi:hypothetical protein
VFAALNLAEAPPLGFVGSLQSRFGAWFSYAIPAAAAAGVLIAVFATQNRDAGLQARGSVVAAGVHPQILGVCFAVRNGNPESPRELASPTEAAPTCPRGGRLKLAYRGANAGERLVVVARGQTTTMIYPRMGDSGPLELTASTSPVWLPGSFAIPSDAAAGKVEILGYFGTENAVRTIEQALRIGQTPEMVNANATRVDRVQYRLE